MKKRTLLNPCCCMGENKLEEYVVISLLCEPGMEIFTFNETLHFLYVFYILCMLNSRHGKFM